MTTHKNLQQFVSALEQAGQLQRITVEVDPILEITEIADRTMKSPGGGPALLFENVKGSSLPLLINTFGSYRRMAMALGVEKLEHASRRIADLINPAAPTGLMNKLNKLQQLLRLASGGTRTVKNAPVQQLVRTGQQINLLELPILQCWPDDAGRYITMGQVLTRHARTGRINLGIYRLQVLDHQRCAVHWHVHHDGADHWRSWRDAGEKQMPVAVVLGGPPALTYAASAPLPPQVDELTFAAMLSEQNIELVRARTVNLYVPAEAEIVIEGTVSTEKLVDEGPFGDHTGYYSPQGRYPLLTVSAITRRQNAVYPATIVGTPPCEDFYLGKATERLFLPVLKMLIPELVDYDLPGFGVFHNFVFLSIKKTYPMQARKVMHAVWGMGQLSFSKFVVVVDEDVDVHDYERLWYAVGANVDPRRDICIVDAPADVLDHAAPFPWAGSKIGIDATRKIPGEGITRPWPQAIRMSKQIKQLVDKRWPKYGIHLPRNRTAPITRSEEP